MGGAVRSSEGEKSCQKNAESSKPRECEEQKRTLVKHGIGAEANEPGHVDEGHEHWRGEKATLSEREGKGNCRRRRKASRTSRRSARQKKDLNIYN